MAKIQDVAKLAGVSISTVSLALNQKERVSEKTFRKVMQAAQEAGYIANPIAKSLRAGSSPILSLIVSDIRTSFAKLFLTELEALSFSKGYLVTLSDHSGIARDEASLFRLLIAQRVAGILISPTLATPDHIHLIKQANIPMVMFDQRLPNADCDFVGLDNQLALNILTRHLIGLGHKRIGLISGIKGTWTSDERSNGFYQTMKDNGLEVDEGVVIEGDFTRQGGYQAATKLLVSSSPVTAIIASNNEMMVGTLQAAQEMGFRCPQDISICCTDGAPWGDILNPRLTHVAQPVEAMAQQASQWLMERINNKQADILARNKLFPPQFIAGSSCARPSK